MKKLISIMLFAFVALAINAQSGRAVLIPAATGDTCVNTATITKIITVTGGYQNLAIQPVLTKLSGTGAGIVTISASQDGTNYYALGDTLGMRDATTVTKLFKYTDPGYTYYKLSYTGVGTMSVKWKIWYTLRKQSVIISTP
jgi:hypothetical protein